MGQSTHTPGPWHRDASSGARCDVRASNGRKIALCWGLSTSRAAQENRQSYRDECDANARLIAAAPDFYRAAMLRREYEALPVDRGGVNGPKGRARAAWLAAEEAAIAKAEARASASEDGR